MSADVQVPDDAGALRRVNLWSKRQRETFLRRGELHLSQVVDEEVEFGGDAAETRLNQPGGGGGGGVIFNIRVYILKLFV